MPSEASETRKLTAIMFTDMVGYSALAQRNEALALELLEEHRRLLRPIFPKHHGREVETAGDAFLVEFVSALEAVRCAVEIQEQLAERNGITPPERAILLRIGIHVGDVVHKDGKVMGDAVNIAARIEPLAAAGGICISNAVYDQIENKVEHALVQLSKPELKNIQASVEVYRLVLHGTGAAEERKRTHADSRQSTSAPWRLRGALTVGAVVVAGLSGFLFWKSGSRSKSPVTTPHASPAAAGVVDQKSIAVLPFVNMSADKADEYLSDGMTEELLNVLAKNKGLRVPGRSSSFAFKGRSEEGIFRKVGEQLHVTTVLEGSVRKAGNQLRITAQLINVADGFHMWSETYDRDMTNIFAIQSDIAARVAEALKVHLLGAIEPQKKPTENIEAYKLYLQGRQLWNRRTGENLKLAVKYFEEAIGKDPGYAMAHAGLADCYLLLPEYAGLPQWEAMPKARAAAMKALELDSSLAEPHATLGYAKADFDWDWPGAEAEFRRALKLNPNYATAHHWFAVGVLGPLRRFDEALAELQRAQELDPLSSVINVSAGEYYSLAGKSDMGIQVLKRQISFDPAFLRARIVLGGIYISTGKLPEAIAELETMRRLEGNGAYGVRLLGFAYARAGQTNEARAILGQLLELQRQGLDHRVDIAMVQHGLGDDESALGSLEQAVEEKASFPYMVNYKPFWTDLLPHPRVQALLKRMNFVK